MSQVLEPASSGAIGAPEAQPMPEQGATAKPSNTTPKRKRLPLPPTVNLRKVLWIYPVLIGGVHLLSLLVFVPYFFSWTAMAVGILGIHVFGQGITIGYHRLLTHRSFRTPKWVEHVFTVLALCSLEDTPAKWVSWHRKHHVHSDEIEDPHSPLVHFLWGHFAWLMFHNKGTHDTTAYHKYARDILEDSFYMSLEKHRWIQVMIYIGHAAAFMLAGFCVGWFNTGATESAIQMALGFLVWGVFARTVAVWHITWSVNSLTHMFGYRNYETGEESRNNWLVALFTVGEGWHNNHHYDQASACNQHKWWEFDLSYYEIRLLEMLGLASRVIRPKHLRLKEREESAG